MDILLLLLGLIVAYVVVGTIVYLAFYKSIDLFFMLFKLKTILILAGIVLVYFIFISGQAFNVLIAVVILVVGLSVYMHLDTKSSPDTKNETTRESDKDDTGNKWDDEIDDIRSSFRKSFFADLESSKKTVRYETSLSGRKSKIVKDPASGKTKTYSYGHGLFGDETRTQVTKGGRLIESGRVEKHSFGMGSTEYSRKSDGTNVVRTYNKGFLNPDTKSTRESGICFKCDGTGQFSLSCRQCDGTGLFTLNAKPCFRCKGSGKFGKNDCNSCNGTGKFKPEKTLSCNRCDGLGERKVTCKKCGGTGRFYKTSFH